MAICVGIFWYVLLYVLSSFFVITLTMKRKLVALLLLPFEVSCYCKYPVALPHGAMDGCAVC